MSFAAQTKKELTLMESEQCCEKAELSALLRMNGAVQVSSQKIVLDVSTENAAIARRIYTLLKKTFQVHTELLVRKKNAAEEEQRIYCACSQSGAGDFKGAADCFRGISVHTGHRAGYY